MSLTVSWAFHCPSTAPLCAPMHQSTKAEHPWKIALQTVLSVCLLLGKLPDEPEQLELLPLAVGKIQWFILHSPPSLCCW